MPQIPDTALVLHASPLASPCATVAVADMSDTEKTKSRQPARVETHRGPCEGGGDPFERTCGWAPFDPRNRRSAPSRHTRVAMSNGPFGMSGTGRVDQLMD